MHSKKNEKKEIYDDLIPAFLAPRHILNADGMIDHEDDILELTDDDVLTRQDIETFPNTPADNENSRSAMIIRESLYRALEDQNITVFMQPIVNLPQRQPQFYEAFGRLKIRSGEYLNAEDYLHDAKENTLLNRHDTMIMTKCLTHLPEHSENHGAHLRYFVNIKPETVRDKEFMNGLLQTLSNDRTIAQQLILEMHYRDFMLLSPAEHKILDALAQLGCRYSLDHVEIIPTDIKMLRKKSVSFIKINAQALIGNGRTESGFQETSRRCNMLALNHIDVIAEKIETERHVREILDYGINYGQGYFFGKPDFQSIYVDQ